MKIMRFGLFKIVLISLLFGISSGNNLIVTAGEPESAAEQSVKLPGNAQWIKTGVNISTGDYVRFTAEGKVEISKWKFLGRNDYSYIVGPEGTYNFDDKVASKAFPMPSGMSGPIPCYSLIGKFNENGSPFFIGKKCSLNAPEDGVLYLGINDFDVSDNKGSFNVNIDISKEKPEGFYLKDTRPVETSPILETASEEIKQPKVLLLYIDGLNYDVLKEMAFTGYLPNLKKYFFDSGADFINSFTIFPSSTFQSAGTTLTGMFLDKTGVKQEMFFDREKLKLDHYFKPFGPNTAARTIRPDFLGQLGGYERKEPLKMIYDYTAENDLKYAATILPVQHTSPPTHVMKTIANSGYFGAHKVHYNLDKINGAYALDHVIKRKNDLMYVWLPGPDVSGHISARGQWGIGRKKLYLIDGIIGKIMEKLKKYGTFDQTYRILYADHGHVGGKHFLNEAYDITNELFFKSIVVKNNEVSDEGGLGFNVKFAEEDRLLSNFHSNSDQNHYMAGAVEGFGMINVYLPYKSKYSGDMLTKNNLYNLTNYTVLPGAAPVNILERMLTLNKPDLNRFPDRVSSKPVDLILLRLAENKILTLKNNGSQAIIERKKVEGGGPRSFVYRYKVVSSIKQLEDGQILYDESPVDNMDPLDYLGDANIMRTMENDPDWLDKFHTAEEWLEITAKSQYPDAVVQFAHFYLWDDSIKFLEKRYMPDFVATASKGWNFRSDGEQSTDHGYPLAKAMKIPLIIAGPTIKKGAIITQPRRIADILPTTLDFLNIDYDKAALDGKSLLNHNKAVTLADAGGQNADVKPDGDGDTEGNDKDALDGKSLLNHNKTTTTASAGGLLADEKPDGDIERLIPFPYSYALPDVEEHDFSSKHPSVSLHDYDNPFDLHHVAADVKFTLDVSVFKISDDVLDLFIPGDKVSPINSIMDMGLKTVDMMPENIGKRRFFELLDALRIRSLSVADMSMLSGNYANEGNLHRANSIIDWTQNIMGDFNKLLGAPVYKFEKGLIPGKHIHKYCIDYPQAGIEVARKSIVEVAGRAIFAGIFGVEYGLGKISGIFKSDNKKESTKEVGATIETIPAPKLIPAGPELQVKAGPIETIPVPQLIPADPELQVKAGAIETIPVPQLIPAGPELQVKADKPVAIVD